MSKLLNEPHSILAGLISGAKGCTAAMSSIPLLRPCGLLLLAMACLLAACNNSTETSSGQVTLRVGYFPNLTHAQGLIGIANGVFAEELGPGVKLDVKAFNAGPSVIEAMFAGQLDMAYIGPNPAINGYVKSKGQEVRIVAGAASGGAALIVRSESEIHSPLDFAGKRIASPQLGNTQDIALRHWLLSNGLAPSESGGDTMVLPTNNPDILTLFQKGEIDGAWVPEPWASRLELEADGQLYLDERDLWPDGQFVTAHLIVSRRFLADHPGIVRRWIGAHVSITEWIQRNPNEAKSIANAEIERLTGKALPQAILDRAWSRTGFTYDPIQSSLFSAADAAFDAGFLGDEKPNLSGIYDLSLLNEVLQEQGMAPIDEVQP